MSKRILDYFIEKRWRDRDIYFYLKLNGWMLFLIIISLQLGIYFRFEERNYSELFYILIGFFSFLTGVIIFSYKGSNFKTLFYCLVHVFSKERLEREIKINESYRLTPPTMERKKPLNKTELIKKHIGVNQSLIRFILERDVRDNLILWSSYLPLDLVNLDYKKQLLSHDRMDSKINCPLNKKEINHKFSLYKECEIIRLFSTYYNFEDYLYCLESKFKEPFPVKNNIKELRDYIMDINEKDYDLEKEFVWLSSLSDKFKVVKNKRELYDWSDLMKNCLKAYDEKLKRKKSVILSYTDFDKIHYVVEVFPEKGFVNEIKGFKNEDPFKSEEMKIKKEIYRAFKKNHKNII